MRELGSLCGIYVFYGMSRYVDYMEFNHEVYTMSKG